MSVTLKDIAKQSGFSVTQVSRALAGYDDVSASTREHIRKIATELGYRPNLIARQLQSQQTKTIGFVMPTRFSHAQDDFFSILLKGITYTAAKEHYDVLISAVETESEELETVRRMAGGRRVDGMIVARTYRNDPRIAYLQSIQMPFIVHGRSAPDEENTFNFIDMDSQQGIATLTQHLLDVGHQHIGIILPPQHLAFTPYRLAGYQQAIGTAFDEQYCIYADLSFEGGRSAAHTLLQRNPQVTAIIGCNDWMALGAMQTAKDHGYIIGETFAIAGYDDIPLASYSDPSLTTIRQPIFEIGTQLAGTLIHDLLNETPTVDTVQRLIQPELVVRDSSGKQSPAQREE